MRTKLVAAVVLVIGASPALAAETSTERLPDPVGFAAGQSMPATLSLNVSPKGRDARMTPVYDNYRPKVVFDGREVVCMFELESVKSLAPGGSAAVSLECKEPVEVHRAATRFTVLEGHKKVGHVDVQLPRAATK